MMGKKKEKKIGSFLIHAELYYRIVDINSFIILRITINLNHYLIHNNNKFKSLKPIELLGQAPFTGLPNEQSIKTGARTYTTSWNQELFFFFFLGRFMLVNF